jgi:hypothetical protein
MKTFRIGFEVAADRPPDTLRSWISCAAWDEGLRVDEVDVAETSDANKQGGER